MQESEERLSRKQDNSRGQCITLASRFCFSSPSFLGRFGGVLPNSSLLDDPETTTCNTSCDGASASSRNLEICPANEVHLRVAAQSLTSRERYIYLLTTFLVPISHRGARFLLKTQTRGASVALFWPGKFSLSIGNINAIDLPSRKRDS